MKARLLRFWQDRRAQDLIEYALISGFVAVAGAAIMPIYLAPPISTIFSKVQSTIFRFGG